MFFKLFSSRPILHRQIFSRPLKKDLHLESISDSAIFPQKSRCSLKKKKKVFTSISSLISLFSSKIKVFSKKKRSSLRFHPWFPYFIPKIKGFSKKKVFTSICCCISLFFSQNHGDLQKLKSKIPRPPLSPFATHRGVGTPSLKSPDLKNAQIALSVRSILSK